MLLNFQHDSFLTVFVIALTFQYKEDASVTVVGVVTLPVQAEEAGRKSTHLSCPQAAAVQQL